MSPSRFTTLAQWLAWQEQLHPAGIALGLERVAAVRDAMGLGNPSYAVITVAGTNGKGSSVAMLEAVYAAAGYRTGAYFSPHLLRYNERVRVAGREVDDAVLCRAFAAVEEARAGTPLTYFEFGTLAAWDIFRHARPEVVILEVGLGGRLDAVNAVDCDAALITAVDLDHAEWLGNDRDAVGREKAGIMRPGRPAICSDPAPPRSVVEHAARIGAPLARLGADYGYAPQGAGWSWWGGGARLDGLPRPSLPGAVQLQNAAGVAAVVQALRGRLPVSRQAIAGGLTRARLAGRLQALPGAPLRLLDVAHNPHAAAVLAAALRDVPCAGATHAVVAMLKDKDMSGVARAMAGAVDHWYAAGLDGARGAGAAALAGCIGAAGVTAPVMQFADPQAAYRAACAAAAPDDRVVVFGSFLTVAAVLALENAAGATNTSPVQV